MWQAGRSPSDASGFMIVGSDLEYPHSNCSLDAESRLLESSLGDSLEGPSAYQLGPFASHYVSRESNPLLPRSLSSNSSRSAPSSIRSFPGSHSDSDSASSCSSLSLSAGRSFPASHHATPPPGSPDKSDFDDATTSLDSDSGPASPSSLYMHGRAGMIYGSTGTTALSGGTPLASEMQRPSPTTSASQMGSLSRDEFRNREERFPSADLGLGPISPLISSSAGGTPGRRHEVRRFVSKMSSALTNVVMGRPMSTRDHCPSTITHEFDGLKEWKGRLDTKRSRKILEADASRGLDSDRGGPDDMPRKKQGVRFA